MRNKSTNHKERIDKWGYVLKLNISAHQNIQDHWKQITKRRNMLSTCITDVDLFFPDYIKNSYVGVRDKQTTQ